MVAERGRPRLAEHIVDVLVPLITEEIVEVLKTVFQEQISERICKQIVEQAAEVPKTSSRDRTLQRAAEQILDVPLPEMVTQLVEVPETVSPDRFQQRTVEQIVDAPVPQVVEELAESFKVSPRTGFNNVLWSRPSKFLLFHSLRRSLRYLSLGRQRRRNRLRTRLFSTTSIQSKWRGPNSSRRQSRRRSTR